MSQIKNPLIEMYGDEALEEATAHIKELATNSNFTFDNEYMQLGIAFMQIKAQEMLDGKRTETSLKSLVTSSFGEAAIAKFQC